MKYQLISDVHLFGKDRAHEVHDVGADALIIAGDLCEWHPKHEVEAGRHFLRTMRGRYGRVFYLPGNHEFYGGRMATAMGRMTAFCADNGIDFIHNNYMDMGDHVVVGHTLWTDMNNGDPMARLAVKRGMADFTYIFTQAGEMFDPTDAMALHRQGLRVIADAVYYARNNNKRVLVMTHHAPHVGCLTPAYKNDFPMNYGYFTELGDMILANPEIGAWVHGHCHTHHDFMFGQCRLMCNAMGYARWAECGYDPKFNFDFPG